MLRPDETPAPALSSHERYLLAGSSDTAIEILIALAGDTSARVRRRVAENPHAPTSLLIKLAQDADPDVRLALAENSSTPEEIIRALAKDEHLDVRFGLAENYRAPLVVLHMLVDDNNPYVAARAEKTLGAVEAGVRCLMEAMIAAGDATASTEPGNSLMQGKSLPQPSMIAKKRSAMLLKLFQIAESISVAIGSGILVGAFAGIHSFSTPLLIVAAILMLAFPLVVWLVAHRFGHTHIAISTQ
jgi:hypothetical protein